MSEVSSVSNSPIYRWMGPGESEIVKRAVDSVNTNINIDPLDDRNYRRGEWWRGAIGALITVTPFIMPLWNQRGAKNGYGNYISEYNPFDAANWKGWRAADELLLLSCLAASPVYNSALSRLFPNDIPYCRWQVGLSQEPMNLLNGGRDDMLLESSTYNIGLRTDLTSATEDFDDYSRMHLTWLSKDGLHWGGLIHNISIDALAKEYRDSDVVIARDDSMSIRYSARLTSRDVLDRFIPPIDEVNGLLFQRYYSAEDGENSSLLKKTKDWIKYFTYDPARLLIKGPTWLYNWGGREPGPVHWATRYLALPLKLALDDAPNSFTGLELRWSPYDNITRDSVDRETGRHMGPGPNVANPGFRASSFGGDAVFSLDRFDGLPWLVTLSYDHMSGDLETARDSWRYFDRNTAAMKLEAPIMGGPRWRIPVKGRAFASAMTGKERRALLPDNEERRPAESYSFMNDDEGTVDVVASDFGVESYPFTGISCGMQLEYYEPKISLLGIGLRAGIGGEYSYRTEQQQKDMASWAVNLSLFDILRFSYKNEDNPHKIYCDDVTQQASLEQSRETYEIQLEPNEGDAGWRNLFGRYGDFRYLPRASFGVQINRRSDGGERSRNRFFSVSAPFDILSRPLSVTPERERMLTGAAAMVKPQNCALFLGDAGNRNGILRYSSEIYDQTYSVSDIDDRYSLELQARGALIVSSGVVDTGKAARVVRRISKEGLRLSQETYRIKNGLRTGRDEKLKEIDNRILAIDAWLAADDARKTTSEGKALLALKTVLTDFRNAIEAEVNSEIAKKMSLSALLDFSPDVICDLVAREEATEELLIAILSSLSGRQFNTFLTGLDAPIRDNLLKIFKATDIPDLLNKCTNVDGVKRLIRSMGKTALCAELIKLGDPALNALSSVSEVADIVKRVNDEKLFREFEQLKAGGLTDAETVLGIARAAIDLTITNMFKRTEDVRLRGALEIPAAKKMISFTTSLKKEQISDLLSCVDAVTNGYGFLDGVVEERKKDLLKQFEKKTGDIQFGTVPEIDLWMSTDGTAPAKTAELAQMQAMRTALEVSYNALVKDAIAADIDNITLLSLIDSNIYALPKERIEEILKALNMYKPSERKILVEFLGALPIDKLKLAYDRAHIFRAGTVIPDSDWPKIPGVESTEKFPAIIDQLGLEALTQAQLNSTFNAISPASKRIILGQLTEEELNSVVGEFDLNRVTIAWKSLDSNAQSIEKRINDLFKAKSGYSITVTSRRGTSTTKELNIQEVIDEVARIKVAP